MACNNCKKEHNINGSDFINEFEKNRESVGSSVMWFVVIWTLLGLYGLVSLIVDLI